MSELDEFKWIDSTLRNPAKTYSQKYTKGRLRPDPARRPYFCFCHDVIFLISYTYIISCFINLMSLVSHVTLSSFCFGSPFLIL